MTAVLLVTKSAVAELHVAPSMPPSAHLQDDVQGPRLRLPGRQLGLLPTELPLEVPQHICQAAVVLARPAKRRGAAISSHVC